MSDHSQVPDFNSTRVLVYGDLMLDRYWYGQTSRISPEAPVPIVHVRQNEVRPGGAANVALNIASLGGKVMVLGLVGEDKEADQLRAALYKESVECQLLAVPGYPTVTKLRVIGQQQQLIRMDFEEVFRQVDDAALIETYIQELARSNVVVLSDYAKGALSNSLRLIQLANQYKVPILVDPKSKDF